MNPVDIISLILVIIGGGVCNILAIYFIVTKKSKTTVKEKIIVLLCNTNLGQIVGFSIELRAATNGSIDEGSCKAAAFITCSLTYTAIGYFFALTLLRWIAVKHPFKYYMIMTNNHKSHWLSIPPLIGATFGIFPFLGWSKYVKPKPDSTYCCLDFEDKTAVSISYFFTVTSIIFVLPTLLTTFGYISIIKELKRAASEAKQKFGRESSIMKNNVKSFHSQSLSSVLVATVYIVSWLPYTYVCFCYYYNLNVSPAVEYISLYLCKSGTILSPVVYCLIEKPFRSYAVRTACIVAHGIGLPLVTKL